MALKTVLIDVGNTLIREQPTRATIYARAGAARGLAVDDARMLELMRSTHDELPERIRGAYRYTDPWFEAYIERIFVRALGLPRGELAGLTLELFERFSDPRTFRLFPGALELLDRLRARGLALGIVSNWSSRLVDLLDGLGVSARVDFVLCSALEGCEKPDRRLFELALQRAGSAPEETLHAGDHPEIDVEGARRVGIQAVLVDHSGAARAFDAPRVRSLPELLDFCLEQVA